MRCGLSLLLVELFCDVLVNRVVCPVTQHWWHFSSFCLWLIRLLAFTCAGLMVQGVHVSFSLSLSLSLICPPPPPPDSPPHPSFLSLSISLCLYLPVSLSPPFWVNEINCQEFHYSNFCLPDLFQFFFTQFSSNMKTYVFCSESAFLWWFDEYRFNLTFKCL